MSAQENPVFRFADCELDPHERRLLVHGQAVSLTPKVFDTLVLLVARAGHVVSKDELMAALWPRGFVHESNLTKHIWMIRRALGDGEEESRYIETVPKLGYRFIAPVQRVADSLIVQIPPSAPVAATSTPTIAVSEAASTAARSANAFENGWVAGRDPERRHDAERNTATADATHDLRVLGPSTRSGPIMRNRGAWTSAAIAVAAVVVAALFGWRAMRAPAIAVPNGSGNAVAIVDFNNLSGNAKDAWLGPALSEMLATEITAGGKLHAVPDELVQPARTDLARPLAGGYAPASLATLHHRLGSDFVLSGSYLVFGNADAPQLRFDLAVQDARNGVTVTDMSRTGAVSDLPSLVIAAGVDLRGRLGVGTLNTAAQRLATNAQPPTTEVARHLGFALDALQKSDPARARDELLQAVAQAPGYAPAYLYLARAWSMLGYRAKAIAASKQALDNAGGLPEEERLQIQAQQFHLQADHANASAAYAKLVALRPNTPEYRLQLVAALTGAGKYGQADAALAAARKLPAVANDPRIELAAANIESARGSQRAVIPHARLALQKAQQRGENGLAAEAELQLGIALGQDKQAEPLLRRAAADFHRLGNPHGEALAWQNVGNLQYARDQINPARESYQRAMTIYQGVGDLGGEAAIYDNLSNMLWDAGDRDGAEMALRQALRIGQETGDIVRQAWSLTGLATILTDESASDEALAMYRQAITLDRQAGAYGHLTFALSYYADLLRIRGQLDEARDICAQAQALDKASQTSAADFECAQIALDRGETDAAITTLTSIENKELAVKDTFNTANAQLVLGQIAMGRQKWRDARDLLQKSLAGWIAQREVPGEATTQALLAQCYAALGDKAARDKSLARARELRGQITARQEAIVLDIALAELQGETGKPDEAIAALRALADDAAKRRWVGLAFEARLAAQRVFDRGADHVAANAARRALDADARKTGYRWVSQRLALASSPAPGSTMPH